jgi:hypothetical protein
MGAACSSYAQGAVDVKSWQGSYEYSGSFFDGIQSVISDITLTIGADGSCSLLWEGFQRDENLVCAIVKSAQQADGVDVEFLSYPDGKLENAFGVAVYHPKERLFSLIKKGDGKLITVWSAKYQPPKTKKSGLFFEKTG